MPSLPSPQRAATLGTSPPRPPTICRRGPARRNANGTATTTRRELEFEYGAADSASDRIGRITGIDDSILATRLAEFDYAGLMRRVARRSGYHLVGGNWQWTISQGFDSSSSTVGYEGLDRFGRITDLHFKNAAAATLHQYQYGYDDADNPLYRHVTQSTSTGSTQTNERSWLFSYDMQHRLTSADMGALGTSNDTIAASSIEPLRDEGWDLDMVGNWDQRWVAPAPGYSTGSLAAAHVTDHRNEIDQVQTTQVITPPSGTVSTATLVYDLAGNLVLDADYFYQYDGWGHLTKVSHRGTLQLDPGGVYDTGAPGDWILHHTYDALGRLIRAQRPIPAGGGSGGQVYTEHYYYDGVRRVQEVHNNPVFPVPPGDDEGSMEEETSPTTANVTWVDREFIHTPGYVDEFVCETDRYDYPWYHLQDANFNVVGLVHEAGVVVRQYTLDPYGRVIRSDQFAAHPVSRLGHQGLFFDRLDAGITTAGLLPEHLGVTSVTGHTPAPWRSGRAGGTGRCGRCTSGRG